MNTDPTKIQPRNWRCSESPNRQCGEGMDNDEILMTKAERIPKSEFSTSCNSVELACSSFGPWDFLRHLTFVICHSNRGQSLTASSPTIPDRKRSSPPREHRAFSLIEVIGVLAVMAILAA